MLKQARKEQSKLLPKEERSTLTLEDIGPRLRELAELKAQKELECDERKKRLTLQPARDSEVAVKEPVELYSELFADETFSGRKHIAQSLVTSVEIDETHARVTYDPTLTRTTTHNGRAGDEDDDRSSPTVGDHRRSIGSEQNELPDLCTIRTFLGSVNAQVIRIPLQELRHVRKQ